MPGTGWQRRNPSGGGASRLPALLLTGLSGCLWPVVCLMRATQCQGGSRLAPGTGGGGGGAGWCALGSGSLSARYQPPVEKLESSADTTGSAGMSGGEGGRHHQCRLEQTTDYICHRKNKNDNRLYTSKCTCFKDVFVQKV